MAGCKYALVDCIAGCGQRIQRRKITDHVKKDCVKRWVKCPRCKKETTFEKLQVRRIIIILATSGDNRVHRVRCKNRGPVNEVGMAGKRKRCLPFHKTVVFMVLTFQLGFSGGNAL